MKNKIKKLKKDIITKIQTLCIFVIIIVILLLMSKYRV